MERVVITGIGAVTPLGLTFNTSWHALLQGETGIRPVQTHHPWKLAGVLPQLDFSAMLSGKGILTLDRFVLYALASAQMALDDAMLLSARHRINLAHTSILVGSSRAGISSLDQASRALDMKKKISPFLMPATTLFMAPATIARQFGIQGECLGISTACASGAHAIGEAFRQIRSGLTNIALAGGSDAPLCDVCFAGYGKAGALSSGTGPEASRPFDKDRDGFVLAEGASMLVLENYYSAKKRNASIYAEIIGYASKTDGFHMTQPLLSSQITLLQKALQSAGIRADDVDHINAHGTSTKIGDKIEAQAITSVFGRRFLPVCALKSMTGHMLAASAAFEIACTAKSLQEGVIPPTVNVRQQDDEHQVSIFQEKTAMPIKTALSLSFGFGGANAALILKKTDET